MVITFDFYSQTLRENQTVNLLLPDNIPASMCRVLYLLHGMYGDYSDWMNQTRVYLDAKNRGLAVVMPSGQNSFYQNMAFGGAYEDYITEELPSFLHRVFGLSVDREKNTIAGLSMGGYGAFYLALSHPDKYCASASLSGCLDIGEETDWHMNPKRPWNVKNFTAIWGGKTGKDLVGTRKDLAFLVEHFDEKKEKPRLFACCGKADDLYPCNLRFRDFMGGRAFDFSFEEGEGDHNWDFWNRWLGICLDKMGLAPL